MIKTIKALELINEYLEEEFEFNDSDMYTISDDLRNIHIGYTTLLDEEIPV